MPVTITVSDRMADELRQWVQDERDSWPEETAYQDDLRVLAEQLDAPAPYPFEPIENAPRDGSLILAAERPPFEETTFFYDVFWCDDRQDYVSGVERALNGASHYIPRDRLPHLPPAEDEPGFYDDEDAE